MYVARVASHEAVRTLAGLALAGRRSKGAAAAAAVACVLAKFFGLSEIPMIMTVPNRHLPGFNTSVCSLSEYGVLGVHVPDPRRPALVMADAWQGTVAALRNSYYNREDLDAVCQVRESPLRINIGEFESFIPEFGSSLETESTHDRDFATSFTHVRQPVSFLVFHIRMLSSQVSVELRAGNNMVSEDECQMLAADVMNLILGRQAIG
jgi:hypothetical protein